MQQVEPDETLDLSEVTCPYNSAKALLKLEAMNSGLILKIIIDDGEPIENVPLAIKDESHEIMFKKKEEDKWILLVKRK